MATWWLASQILIWAKFRIWSSNPEFFRCILGGRHFREDKIAIYIHLWYSQPAMGGRHEINAQIDIYE